MENANKELRAQVRDLSSKFSLLLSAYVKSMLIMNAFKLVLQRIVTEYGRVLAALASFRSVRATLEPWVQRLSFLPDNLDKAVVFSITPRDFGYDSWLDRTPDSGFFEKYILRSHLLNGAVAHEDFPAVFPDFMWIFSEDRTEDRGLAAWFLSGPPTGFPLGDLAVSGHRNWYRRMSETIDAVFEFVEVFRQVVWPSTDPLSLGD